MTIEAKSYSAILIDTSIFDENGLHLEKGLLGKLSQFKKSPIDLIFPDIIKNEVKNHLEVKMKNAKTQLKKALNNAGDHLFIEDKDLDHAKAVLVESKEINELVERRIDQFVLSTGALELDCSDYVSVSSLLANYFSNKPPFAETGKKKNEFPDAIVLMAVDAWAKDNDVHVLAVSSDKDWENFCNISINIDYQKDLPKALSSFNTTNAPYELLANIEKALKENTANAFLSTINNQLEALLNGLTPEQEAESHLYWEAEGCHIWLHDFEFADTEFNIIDKDEDWVVLETLLIIKVEAEGEFSFSMYDSIDRDHVYMGGITRLVTNELESEVLIKISGNLSGEINDLCVDEVEILTPVNSIDFGTIEPNYSEYD